MNKQQKKPNKIFELLKKYFYPFLLLAIVCILAYLNYKPGTWFSGWDNLHQEFDFSINWERHLFASWQEYQGLGLPATMAHAADLPRMVIIWILDLFLPSSLIRYTYFFICLYVGSLGLYNFLNWILGLTTETQKPSTKPNSIRRLGFLGALFFILNLGTLHVFYNPISMFPTQWAALPWLFLTFLRCIRSGGAKNYLKYALVSLLAAPMAYTPTLFFMYAAVITILSIIILAKALFSGSLKFNLKRISALALITIFVNSFWLFPFIGYFFQDKGETVYESQINAYVSEDIYARNRARGSIKDVLLLKGFNFDNYDYSQEKDDFIPMMSDWSSHLSAQLVTAIGYLMFSVILLGVGYSLYQKVPYSGHLFLILLFSFFFLLNSTPPTGFLFDKIREISPTFREAMRFPYTKIIQLATFIYAVYFGLGIECLHQLSKKLIKSNTRWIISFSTVFLLLTYSLPMFTGNLLYDELKVEIPSEYFDMFEWFKDQPEEPRIANLPQAGFMNWYHYYWGHRGSGFMWYGLKQPVLDRSFDVWSSQNEQYYNELSYAIYNLDTDSIDKIAEKYHIGWFVYDKNMKIGSSENEEHFNYYQDEFIPKLIEHENFELKATFNDKIMVIEYDPVVSSPSNISTISDPISVGPEFSTNYQDLAYDVFGNYISDEDYDINYLSRDLTHFQTELLEEDQSYRYSSSINTLGTLYIPDYWDVEKYVTVDVYSQGKGNYIELTFEYRIPEIYSNEIKIFPKENIIQTETLPLRSYILTSSHDVLEIPKPTNSEKSNLGSIILTRDEDLHIYDHTAIVSDDLTDVFKSNNLSSVRNCAEEEFEDSIFEKSEHNDSVEILAQNAIACTSYVLPTQNTDFLLKVDFDYKSETGNFPDAYIMKDGERVNRIELAPLKPATSEIQHYTGHFTISGTSAAELYLQLHTGNDDKLKELYLEEIQISTYPLSSNIQSHKKLSGESISFGKGDLSIVYPKLQNISLAPLIDLREVAQQPVVSYTGALLHEGDIQQEVDYDPISGLTFYSQNSITYSRLWFGSQYPQDLTYLLSLDYDHEQGLPLEIQVNSHFFNSSMPNFMLPSEKVNHQVFRVIPQTLDGSTGFEINGWNTSRGNFPTQNSISDAHFQFYPYNFISKLYTKELGTPSQNLNNSLQISETKRVFPFLYSATADGNGYLNLKQSYNSGWQIYTGGKSHQANNNHILVNNWSNGWLIDNTQKETVYIIYTPQLLEFIGLIALFFTLAMLTGRTLVDRKQNSPITPHSIHKTP